jgi:hypothetical protein
MTPAVNGKGVFTNHLVVKGEEPMHIRPFCAFLQSLLILSTTFLFSQNQQPVSGNLLNFVCRNAGTTPYANSARGCLQTYWDQSTGTYSYAQGGDGTPGRASDPTGSTAPLAFGSFLYSHAVCLTGAFFH